MAPKGITMGLVLILALMLWGETKAQSGCTTALISLAPCLNYVSGNSSSTPSSSCCSQLSNVVQTQPQCLCSLLNGGGTNLGLSINETMALSLPSACNVQTPPVSKCNGAANGPTSSSAEAPVSNLPSDEILEAPTSSSNPTISSSPSGGSKSGSTSKNTNVSKGTIAKAPTTRVLVFALFLVLCEFTMTKF